MILKDEKNYKHDRVIIFFFANAVRGREIMMKSIGFTDCKWPNEHAEMTEDEPGILRDCRWVVLM